MSATPWVVSLAGGLAFLLVALGMRPAIRGWQALGRKDREVSLRKVHAGEIPRVGGFVLMLGFAIVAIRGLAGTTELSAAHEWFSQNPITGAVLGALICGAFGLYDDLVGLRARYKLFGQVLAATIAVFGFGLHWQALAALLGPAAALADPLTVLFLVAGVNAINLSDGLDGLAGGNVALGLLVVACLGPAAILNEDGTLKEGEIAARFSLLGMLLTLGALRFRLVGRARVVFLGAIVLFGGLKTAECWRIHRAFQREAQAFADEILAKIPPHSRLLPLFAVAHPSRADFVRHRMGSYVVPLCDGYSPHVFATLGQHPLRHRRGPMGLTGDWREVDELRLHEDEWSFYGYVLVQTDQLEAAMDRVVPGLVQHAGPVAAEARFRLYRLGPK